MNMAFQHFCYMIFSPARLPAFLSNRMEFQIPNFCVWFLYAMTLLISTNLFIPTTLVKAFENETDRITLLKFKEAITTDPHGSLKSWNDSTHFCKWQGITCDTGHQRVTNLSLGEYDLHGTISPYIGNLSFLRFINLSLNSFSGKIPHQLDHLFRLRFISLYGNLLEGGIPANLSFCPELEFINFGRNHLSGNVPEEIGRLMKLKFFSVEFNKLSGMIPAPIFNISSMKIFSLASNEFSGTIPPSIGINMPNLQILFLDINNFSGHIPVSISNASQLSKLGISANNLVGNVPSKLGLLVKLVFLLLEKNYLTGGIPPSIGNLSSLSILSLNYNNLVGNIPEEIGRLRYLYHFKMSANKLSGTIPAPIFNISSLTNFSLSSNEFSGTIPPTIGIKMPNLQELLLGNNKFSGHIPASISNASQLVILDIPLNNFVGGFPITPGGFPNLQWLGMRDNSLGSYSFKDLEFITALTNCSQLTELDIGHNKFGGVLPSSVANLSTQLTSFYLGYNQFSGTIPETFTNLENLIVLSLVANLFTGVIPASFGKFQKLQALYLSFNGLSGSVPSSIGNLTRLFTLHLSANELEGNIPPSIGDYRNLQNLDLSENKLSGDIPTQIFGLSTLLYLNLSHNSLSGSLPVEMGKLIYALYISGNNLTGEIPDSIGDCLSLEFLYLDENNFQGIIPASLASLRGLPYLDLSRNNLSGQIPKGLERLPFLKYLNLSFNNLEGEVPKEGAFLNTSVVFLAGNAKLCGGVLELHLPACSIEEKNQHGFKWKLTLSIVGGGFVLLLILLAIYSRRKSGEKSSTAVLSTTSISKVSYKALYKATDGFSASTLIGSGGFGSVYRGILDEKTNEVVAIKVLNLQQRGASKSFTAECNALRNIRHRNLVKILTCCSSIDYKGNEFKALVFEYMSNGSLEEWLHTEIQSRSLNLLQRLNIVVDVASALCYLHNHCEPRIIHCDIKPSNVLLDDGMVAYVCDFGIARLISTTADNFQNKNSTIGIKGTIGYTAPEYASGVDVSRQGDVYSYGILVLEMFTGRRPTDELFRDGLILHNFVKMAIPTGRLLQIVDPTLLAILGETTYATTESEVNNYSDYNIDIEAEEDGIVYERLGNMNTYVCKCILPILKIGLACSEESPMNRMSMEDVTKHLHHIKNAYASIDARERPRRS